MPPVREHGVALYVHIPFCVRKCPYCAFISHELKQLEQADEVIAAIHRQADLYLQRDPWATEPVHSLFIGGGTPSTLSGPQVRKLVDGLRERFTFSDDAECTIEVNPGNLTDGKVMGWQQAGLNRVSLGVQSLHTPTLQRLGRIHTAEQAKRGFERVRDAGFAQLSVDLMYGIEVEDALDGWRDTVVQIASWQPDHISAYALTIEPGTPFEREAARGIKVKPDEEVEMAQYEVARDVFVGSGYQHYEISNWARPGNRCRHNISYWDGGSYLALGPAGHAYDALNQVRFWNEIDTTRWLEMVEQGGDGVAGRETLDALQRYEERLALDLRMIEGASEEVAQRYAAAAGKSWPPPILPVLIEHGLVVREAGVIRYSERGHHLADELEVQLTR
ncbi:radical SAM family heme chaperone HemW [bacterium]|nr:radical SAM family heme chaperone HemW [bacterium]